ncbi:MAG TPA: hypothetical protein VE944_24630 [Nostoc sp.]|uniref:hypothetical protein n=1 Tax=Nostoc sp. TaxID=1180 RepID=UPI002D5F9F60|nr:hypothetical protein [Nostoc sp.]HYX15685.1 hypothetical protein [Nostoc sp.]HYX17483.1 hypothetical protein [Nostoc sp.]
MNQLTDALSIAVTEHRYDFVCNITAEIVATLEKQGLTFDELLDGLANYAFLHSKSTDAACFLVRACLSARKAQM